MESNIFLNTEVKDNLNINLVSALQTELAALQAKVITYYNDELVLRGDKILNREYKQYFQIE